MTLEPKAMSVWEQARSLFPASNTCLYLDHAAVGPTSTRVRAAIAAGADAQTNIGLPAAESSRAEFARVRMVIAELIGGTTASIALLHNTSTALSIAANGIDWQPGENVVLASDEFPSNFYPWQILRSRGVEVRLVERDATGSALGPVSNAVDSKTRAVAISAVHYSNGFRQDTANLAQTCRQNGALLVVDGTQAVGAVHLDVVEEGIDVLAVGGYKWMLGPLGTAFAYFSDTALERLAVSTAGWMSVEDPFNFDYTENWDPTARRFEAGTENTVGIFGLGAAVDMLLELGIQPIENRLFDLIDHAAAEAGRLGINVLNSISRPTRSGIIVLANPSENPEISRSRLMTEGVLCSYRGGGVRFSPHFYTRESEITDAMQILADAASTRRIS